MAHAQKLPPLPQLLAELLPSREEVADVVLEDLALLAELTAICGGVVAEDG